MVDMLELMMVENWDVVQAVKKDPLSALVKVVLWVEMSETNKVVTWVALLAAWQGSRLVVMKGTYWVLQLVAQTELGMVVEKGKIEADLWVPNKAERQGDGMAQKKAECLVEVKEVDSDNSLVDKTAMMKAVQMAVEQVAAMALHQVAKQAVRLDSYLV